MQKSKKYFKIIISLLLVTSMVLSTSLIVFADNKTINYVSMGDSLVNGYRLDSGFAEAGFLYPADSSYPVRFANYLKENYEDCGYTVKLTPIAVDGFRASDYNFMLDLDFSDDEFSRKFHSVVDRKGYYVPYDEAKEAALWNSSAKEAFFDLSKYGDYRMWDTELRFNIDPRHLNLSSADARVINDPRCDSYEAIAFAMQDAIANADIISYGGGGSEILFIVDALANAIADNDTTVLYDANDIINRRVEDEKVRQILRSMTKVLNSSLKTLIGDEFAYAINLIEYQSINYLISYAYLLEQISEINTKDNLDFIYVGLVNNIGDLKVQVGNLELPLGKIYGLVCRTLSTYTALIPYTLKTQGKCRDMNFYYSRTSNASVVGNEMDQLDEEKLDILKTDIIENFLEEDENYFPLGSDSAVIDGIKDAIIKSTKKPLKLSALLGLFDTDDINQRIKSLIEQYRYSFDFSYDDVKNAVSSELNDDDEISAVLCLFAYSQFDEGIGVHASAKGHDALFDKLVKTYNRKVLLRHLLTR